MLKLQDRASVKGAKRTEDGYLVAEAFVAREGVQLYRGSEVGNDEMSVVRVLRPKDEVMDPASVRSYTHAPVTMGHPSDFVTADNWKDLAKGEVSTEAEWVDGKLRLPLILKDSETIKSVESGTRELSAGYSCALDWTSGVDPIHGAYDAVQRSIRINHVAVVDAGRAGSECRIGDDAHVWGVSPITTSDHKEDKMSDALQLVVLGDAGVHVAPKDAQIIDTWKRDMQRRLDDAATAHQKALDEREEEIGTLKADLQSAKDAAITPEKVSQLVAERVSLESVVKAIDGAMKVDGISDADLRKAIVVKKMGDVGDASEAEIKGMFKAIAKSVPVQDQFRSVVVGDRQSAAPGGKVLDVNDARQRAEAARQRAEEARANAWKGNSSQKGA